MAVVCMVLSMRVRIAASDVALCLLVSLAFAAAGYAKNVSVPTPRAADGQWEIALVPPLTAGWIGWCSEVVKPSRSGGSCPVDPESGEPLVDEGWSGSAPPPTAEGYVITSGEVSSVSVGGSSSIMTRSQPRLPFGLRAALVEIPGIKLFDLTRTFRSFTLLGNAGQPLSQPRTQFRVDSVPTKFWQRPKHPPRGVCALSSGLTGLKAEWGSVALHAAGRKGILGQGFLSCIETEYYMRHWPLQATLLLNGETPGAPPATLPNMRPLPRHHAIMVEHGVLARRLQNAWLLVTGGSGLAQRIEVLDGLRAKIF
jgi:hypothetical protein